MVETPGKALRTDRLRVLNTPRRIEVDLDGEGNPTGVGVVRIEAIIEDWRISDEWWRAPIERRYVEVVLEGGKHVVLYHDLITEEWFAQMP